ncbi:MAG: DUF2577 domain-containing protein [Bacteroidales bacterium]|nr:DUF2577 domain-containing protein [Bacteroidales bacterium]
MQDPYSELLSKMRKQGESVNPPGIRLAEVVSPPPNIAIRIGEMPIDKDNILIADYLLPGYTRETEQKSAGTIITHIPVPEEEPPTDYSEYTAMESLTHEGTVKFTDTLKAGDIVAAMPTEDGQTYIILTKVVSL